MPTPSDRVMQIYEELPSKYRLKLLQDLEEKTCAECGSLDLREIDRQLVCMSCAVEHNDGGQVRHFTKDYFTADFALGAHGKPPTNLAFGRGQGNTIRRKDLYQVLAKGVGGKKDVGLRARQIRIFQSCSEHPTIRNMLEIGSDLCEEFGMVGNDAVFFADHLGKFLRKVGAAAILQKTNGQSVEIRHLAVSTFVYVWQLMERDRGIRNQISFEPIFPGKRRISEGTWQGRGIKPDRYKIRAKDWDFVLWNCSMQPDVPTTKKPLMEDPQVLKLLQMGRVLCSKWFGDVAGEFGVWICPDTKAPVDGKQFFERFSKILIRVGEFCVGSGMRFPQKEYADVCFVLTMKQIKGNKEYFYAAERLNVDSNLIISVLKILERTR